MKRLTSFISLFIFLSQGIASPWALDSSKIEGPFERPPKKHTIPEAFENVALKKPVNLSDKFPIMGSAEYVTDGFRTKKWKDIYNSESEGFWDEGHVLEIIAPSWIQVDLEKEFLIRGVGLWYPHLTERYDVPYSVVVQLSNREDFSDEVTTIYNTDYKNLLGQGKGADAQFATSRFGKFISTKPTKARFVRVWGTGSARHSNAGVLRIIEIEVYAAK